MEPIFYLCTILSPGKVGGTKNDIKRGACDLLIVMLVLYTEYYTFESF